jgi:uncharacterized linocin/CFP29 family protein
MKGERKSRFRGDRGKGFNSSTSGNFNITYKRHQKGSEAQEQINKLRRGDTTVTPMTSEILQHLSTHKTDLKLPTKPGEQVAVGRGSGRDNKNTYKNTLAYKTHKKQAVIEKNPLTGKLQLRSVASTK